MISNRHSSDSSINNLETDSVSESTLNRKLSETSSTNTLNKYKENSPPKRERINSNNSKTYKSLRIKKRLSNERRSFMKAPVTALRSSKQSKSLMEKRRVVRMLFVLVLEFFICWAPLYIIMTLQLWIPKQIYDAIGNLGVSLVLLLAYISSCCNPITYCFMNKAFLQNFKQVFGCRKGELRWRASTVSEYRSSMRGPLGSLTQTTKLCHQTGCKGSFQSCNSTIIPTQNSSPYQPTKRRINHFPYNRQDSTDSAVFHPDTNETFV